MHYRRRYSLCVAGVLLCLTSAFSAVAVERVTLRRDDKKDVELVGRSIVTAQDGGRLLLARDGVLWLLQPEEQISPSSDKKPFASLSREDLGKHVLSQLPPGFRVHSTSHYLILYDTSQSYAQWCGSLFERLYMAFTNFWSRKGFELHEPEFPLVAVVFADKAAYLKHAAPELGKAAPSIIGYYHMLSNRMTMYDLTGFESQGHARLKTSAQINYILAQPDAAQTVATIVHEATHQIAFNCGLHQRLSACPHWVSEGIAMYFETPDLRSAKGWGAIGNINGPRLEHFTRRAATRPANWMETLVGDDRRLTDSKAPLDAYAEAWALTYFLIRQHPKEYIAYLRTLSAKQPLMQDGPEKRLEDFRNAFGNLAKLNTEFNRYASRNW